MKHFFLPLALASVLVVPAIAVEPPASPGYEVKPWPAGQKTPELRATALDGKVWALKDLRGRAVLVNFWASWCEPCRAEMPSLQALTQLEGDDRLVILAVNHKEPVATIARYVQTTQLSLPVLPDPQGVLAGQWGVSVYPSTVLIGADGRVRSVVRGELDWTGDAARKLIGPLFPRSP
jgi:thiol-disulfide isomerase/thioredoxin